MDTLVSTAWLAAELGAPISASSMAPGTCPSSSATPTGSSGEAGTPLGILAATSSSACCWPRPAGRC